MRIKILAFVFICLLISCSADVKINYAPELKNYFTEISTLAKFPKNGVVVIIPLDGCSTCLHETIDAIKQNAEGLKITVVLTAMHKKLIENKFTEFNLDSLTDGKDLNYIASRKQLVNNMPVAYIIENSNCFEKYEINSVTVKDVFSRINEFNKTLIN